MLKRLETTHFKKLESAAIDLSAGSNIVVGDNGNGKTTVFEAIRFALFGASAVTGSTKFLPTYGHKNCRVKLWVKDYLIDRTLTNCKITDKNGAVVAEGKTTCTEFMQTELKMDAKGFSVFSMSQQGETQALLTLGVTELNRRVEKYAGVHIIDEVVRKASADKNTLDSHLDGKQYIDIGPMTIDKLCHDEALKDMEAIRTDMDEEKAKLQDLLTQHRRTIDVHAKHNQRILMNRSDARELESKKDGLLEEVRLTQVDIDAALLADDHTHVADEKTLERCRDGANRLQEQVQEVAHLEYEQALLLKRVAKLTPLAEQETDAQARLPDMQEKLFKLNKLVHSLNGTVMLQKSELGTFETLLKDGVCPTCHRSHEGFDETLTQEQINSLSNSIAFYREKLNAHIAEEAALDSKVKTLLQAVNGHNSALAVCQEDLKTILEKLSTYPAALKANLALALQKVEDLLKEKALMEQAMAHFEQLANRLNRLNASLKLTNTQLVEAKHLAQGELFEVSRELDELLETENTLAVTNSKLLEQQTQISEIEFRLEKLCSEIITHQKANKEYNKNAAKHDKLTKLVDMLRSKRQDFMAAIWHGILASSSAFVNDATGGWITAISRDDSGNFTFSENGGIFVPVVGGASGAQKAFLGVGVRVGLGHALLGCNMALLLDEPTEAMSEENAGYLADALLALGGQTLFITHRNTEAVSAQRVIKI